MVIGVAFVIGIMLHACVVYAVLDDGGDSSRPATVQPATQQTVRPTSTPLPDRTSCEAIRGSDYRSESERAWFRANCTGATARPSPTSPRAYRLQAS